MAARPQCPTTAVAHQGGSRFFFLLLTGFWCSVLLAATTPPDESLERVRTLTRGGATQLALRLIDEQQPSPDDTASWIRWEKERFALLRAQRDWTLLAARVINLPAGLPDDFMRWARAEAARAELHAGRPADARRFLGELLLSAEGNRDERAEWRQLVIRSYLLDNNVDDALTALKRYRADYRVDTPAWRLLEANILLRASRPREAYLKVGEIKTHEGRLLGLLAALRAGVMPPLTVLSRAEGLARETRNKPALQAQAWVLAAEAAGRASHTERVIHALERALTLARDYPGVDKLFEAHADVLWQAYERFAEITGNDARLLIGDDVAWFKRAESYKRDDAMQARAFYAFLARHATTGEHRERAVRRFTDSLIEDGRGEVLRALYTTGSRAASLSQLPEYVRYRLVELALAGYDIAFAGQLMQGLDEAPSGEDQETWRLRRARVLVYAGEYEIANGLLTGILEGRSAVDDAFTERFLQVIFDLQAARRFDESIALLESLFDRVDNPRTQREVLYWIAESKSAQGHHRKAAELYLQSATWKHPTGGDMWGQTARYHAAEELGKAGLTQDARLVFQALLKHTADAKQRAAIERSIQQLWLIEKKVTTP